MWIDSGSTVIESNFIGTNASGGAAVGNQRWGIVVQSGAPTIGGIGVGNVISGNVGGQAGGIYLGGAGAVVKGNTIGLNAARTAAIPNGDGGYFGSGIDVRVGTGHVIGGVLPGEGNVIASNSRYGIRVEPGAQQATIRGNSMYSNTGLGIDLSVDGVTANDGALTVGAANQLVDSPVLTSVSLSGSTLTISGYVGSAAGQAPFANALVDVYVADGDGTGFGEGQTYLGTVTASTSSGTFSATVTVPSGVTISSSTRFTATATLPTGETSEFGANVALTRTLSGTVFEDVNYGGGAGRSFSASSGTGVSDARVELYGVSGSTATFLTATTTDTAGAYRFTATCSTCAVRVVGSSVRSTRTGSTSALIGVPTFMTDAATGAVASVNDRVGGMTPASAEAPNGATGAAFSTATGVYSAGIAGTAQAFTVVSGITAVSGLDFGWNFDTVTNTNDAGPGSLRQVLANATALGGETSLAQAGRTAGFESTIFQLRSTDPGYQTATGDWRITALSTLTVGGTRTALDGLTQTGAAAGNLWAGTPHTLEIEISGNGGTSSVIEVTGTDNVVSGVVIGNTNGTALRFSSSTRGVLRSSYVGLRSDGSTLFGPVGTTSVNAVVDVADTSSDVTVGGPGGSDGNVITGNAGDGVMTRAGTTGTSIVGNFVGSNALGSATRGSLWWAGINNFNGTATWRDVRANLIVGSPRGIAFESDDVVSGTVAGRFAIAGNYIGVARDGATLLGNDWGIATAGSVSGLTIGGPGATDANLIAGNRSDGIAITNTNAGVGIQRNRVWGNTGLGIDLRQNGSVTGVTANDGAVSTGQPNQLMDFRCSPARVSTARRSPSPATSARPTGRRRSPARPSRCSSPTATPAALARAGRSSARSRRRRRAAASPGRSPCRPG